MGNLLVLCWSPFFLHAQDTGLDSLVRSLENKRLNEETRIRIYDDLTWKYLNIGAERSITYSQNGIELAEAEKDTTMIVTLYRNMGLENVRQRVETYDGKINIFSSN